MTVDRITDGVVVSLAYSLTVDGQLVEQVGADEPLEYLHGADMIVPGLEAVLDGKQVGDKLHVTLPPDQAYGDYDEDEIEEIDLDEMPESDVLEEGMMVEVEDEDGETYYAFVAEITDDTVILDFNPPLAGKTLTYDVEVLRLRQGTPEEIDHGHLHAFDDEE
jgi:FKBP-type peptidyl-prolyl cis-trans isomerase SlyD